MSLKGIRIQYLTLAISLIAIVAGVYLVFFQNRGLVKTEAEIVSIVEIPSSFADEAPDHEVTVTYTVDGKTYTEKLDYYSGSFKVGKTIKIMYDPADPSVVHGGQGFGIYILCIGIVLFAYTVFSAVMSKKDLKELKESGNAGTEATYPPTQLGDEREVYFLTDMGTPKFGHRIEDASRRVLYEAKMTKFTLTKPFGFDFIDHEHKYTRAHLVGHEENSEWSTIFIDSNSSFTFDGEDIWKHLKRNGISVDSTLGGGSGKILGMNFVISRDGVEIARAESTGRYVHEEDAEEHSKISNAVSSRWFYRVWTRAEDLQLVFLTLMAFARTSATADDGGNYRTLFNTLKKKV